MARWWTSDDGLFSILTAVMDERGTNSCTAAGALFLPVEAVAHGLTASAKLRLRKHMPGAD